MDQLGVDIKDIDITKTNIIITYQNDHIEMISKCCDGYKNMYNEWLLNDPPFISDIFKKQMRDLTLYSINQNAECFNYLNNFFTYDNKDNVLRFLVYMRNRDVENDRRKWNKL
jgi:hypothetical protein